MIINLFDKLNGRPSYGGTWAYVSGDTPYEPTLTSNGDIIVSGDSFYGCIEYAYTVSGTCSTSSSNIKIIFEPCCEPFVNSQSYLFCLNSDSEPFLIDPFQDSNLEYICEVNDIPISGGDTIQVNDVLVTHTDHDTFLYITPLIIENFEQTITIKGCTSENKDCCLTTTFQLCFINTENLIFDLDVCNNFGEIDLLAQANINRNKFSEYEFLLASNPPNSGSFNDGLFNVNGLEQGTYEYIFTAITQTSACYLDVHFTINVTEKPNVGQDISLTYCEGEIINLFNILQEGTSDTITSGGVWTIKNNRGFDLPNINNVDLINGTFDTSNHAIGQYCFTYCVTDVACGDCCSSVNIIVDPCSIQPCECYLCAKKINLKKWIIGEPYMELNMEDYVMSTCDCEPYIWHIHSVVGATYTGTPPLITITPTDEIWEIVYGVCCSDGIICEPTYCETNSICGTACDIVIEPTDCCFSLSASIDLEGFLLLDEHLFCNGIQVSDYEISWRDSLGNEKFKSAFGSFYDPNIHYEHLNFFLIPVTSDDLYPVIINSSLGDPLEFDCLEPITPLAIPCPKNIFGHFTRYNGDVGVHATYEQDHIITSDVNVYACFKTIIVPDRLEIIYNGIVIFDTGNIATGTNHQCYNIPITYVVGQDTFRTRVTNSSSSGTNTVYELVINCCDSIPCTDVDLTFFTPSINSSFSQGNCSCRFEIDTALESTDNCGVQYDEFHGNKVINVPYCEEIQSNIISCIDTPIIFSTLGFNKEITLSDNVQYLALKSYIQTLQTNANVNEYMCINFYDETCGTINNEPKRITIFPNNQPIFFDDVLQSIQVNFVITPFVTDCSNCESILLTYFSATKFGNNDGNYLALDYSTKNVQSTVISNIEFKIGFIDNVTPCENTRKFEISFADTNCPCDTWILREDTTNNGIYDTLISDSGSNSC